MDWNSKCPAEYPAGQKEGKLKLRLGRHSDFARINAVFLLSLSASVGDGHLSTSLPIGGELSVRIPERKALGALKAILTWPVGWW